MAREAGPKPTQSKSCISSAGEGRNSERPEGACGRGSMSETNTSDFRAIGSMAEEGMKVKRERQPPRKEAPVIKV